MVLKEFPAYGENAGNTNSEFGENSLSRNEIVARMQELAPAGQQTLDPDTHNILRLYTGDLAASCSAEAQEDYDRYHDTERRQISLCVEALKEVHEDKTILVTGGTGLIGTVLMRELSRLNPAAIVSLSRGLTVPLELVPGVSYQTADITDSARLDEVFDEVKPDIVYHLAANKYPGLAEEAVAATLTTNIMGTENVLASVKKHGVDRLAYASTGKTIRPFSPDTYAASKKASEWLLADFAASNDTLCSAGRFTHVVDHSDFMRRLHGWIDAGDPISLHGAEVSLYVQSATESAQLLMNSTLDAERGNLQVNAIRDLGWPVGLANLALGAIIKTQSEAAIYFSGFKPGYEEESYIDLYDPMTAGDVSPLISSLEAKSAQPSKFSNDVDSFPLSFVSTPQLRQSLQTLKSACIQNQAAGDINALKDDLSWTMLEARLLSLPLSVVERAAKRIQIRHAFDVPKEHAQIDQTVLSVLDARTPNQ